MKKFLMPLFLLATLSVGFSSCSSDDDDDTPVVSLANVTLTVNGEESPKEVTLTKGTILGSEGETGEDDMLKFVLKSNDNSKIKKVQITVTNSYEVGVPVVDELGNVYNDKFVYENPSTEKTINFTGVYGKYTIKVTNEKGAINAYNVNVTNEKGHFAYSGSGSSSKRYLSNLQTVYLDSKGEKYSNKFNTLTYITKDQGGVSQKNFGNAALYAIDEEQYSNWQAQKGEFEAEAVQLKFAALSDLSMEKTEFLVYKYGDIYYLIHVLSIKDNIIKFNVQY